MTEQISSLQNEKVKNLIRLQKKPSERKSQGLFVIEGIREISLALKNNTTPHSFFVCDDVYSPDSQYPVELNKYSDVPIYKVSKAVYEKIAYRGDTQGVIMIAAIDDAKLNNEKVHENGIYLVLESIEKPGNLGAVFRTADAAGINGIIICGQTFDIYNPNVIRSSLGCIFTVQFMLTDNVSALKMLKESRIQILAAHPEGETSYSKIDYKKGSAVVFGSESEGLSEFWLDNADKLITIPMMGQIDSLNISVSASIITYEALRQRLSN